MNYQDMTTEQLTACINSATQERDRRLRLEQIPRQIAILTDAYVAAGGNPDDLTREGAVD